VARKVHCSVQPSAAAQLRYTKPLAANRRDRGPHTPGPFSFGTFGIVRIVQDGSTDGSNAAERIERSERLNPRSKRRRQLQEHAECRRRQWRRRV
jgi:hypothetical protein